MTLQHSEAAFGARKQGNKIMHVDAFVADVSPQLPTLVVTEGTSYILDILVAVDRLPAGKGLWLNRVWTARGAASPTASKIRKGTIQGMDINKTYKTRCNRHPLYPDFWGVFVWRFV